jgi:hypothetical protein
MKNTVRMIKLWGGGKVRVLGRGEEDQSILRVCVYVYINIYYIYIYIYIYEDSIMKATKHCLKREGGGEVEET